METQALKIKVFEEIRIAEVIADGIKRVADLAKKVWNLLFSDEPDQEPEDDQDDSRAPPALGVSVAEEVKVTPFFGRTRESLSN